MPQAVLKANGEVTRACKRLLDGDRSPEAHQALRQAIEALEASRVTVRFAFLLDEEEL